MLVRVIASYPIAAVLDSIVALNGRFLELACGKVIVSAERHGPCFDLGRFVTEQTLA
jgi:hypothetical protein